MNNDCSSIDTFEWIRSIKVNADMETQDDELTYNDLFVKFSDESSTSIGAAYDAIEQILVEADVYFQVRFVFNSLLSIVEFFLSNTSISRVG
jgi:hypothetical protein